MREVIASWTGADQQGVGANNTGDHLPCPISTLVAIRDGMSGASAEDTGNAAGSPGFKSSAGRQNMADDIAADSAEKKNCQEAKSAESSGHQRADQRKGQKVRCEVNEIEMNEDRCSKAPHLALVNLLPGESTVAQKVGSLRARTLLVETKEIQAFKKKQVDQNLNLERLGLCPDRFSGGYGRLQSLFVILFGEQALDTSDISIVDQ